MKRKLFSIGLVLICLIVGMSVVIASSKEDSTKNGRTQTAQEINNEIRLIMNAISNNLKQDNEIEKYLKSDIALNYQGPITIKLSVGSSNPNANELAKNAESIILNSIEQLSDSITNAESYTVQIESEDGKLLIN